MSWAGGWLGGPQEGREKLSSLDNLPIGISKKGFKAVDLLYAFAKEGGSSMVLANRLSREFNLKDALLSGRVKVLTENRSPRFA